MVPGNDDAIKSCDLIIRTIADSMEAGKQKVKPEEFAEQAAPAPAPAPDADADAGAAPPAEEAPADEQLSQGESAEETAKAEEVPAE